jgi:hypothetical protein
MNAMPLEFTFLNLKMSYFDNSQTKPFTGISMQLSLRLGDFVKNPPNLSLLPRYTCVSEDDVARLLEASGEQGEAAHGNERVAAPVPHVAVAEVRETYTQQTHLLL